MKTEAPLFPEGECRTLPGWLALAALIALFGLTAGGVYLGVLGDNLPMMGGSALALTLVTACFGGFFIVNPNEAKIVQLFGAYVGSVKKDGFHWANPLYSKKHLSLRINSFESSRLKVNDLDGNPIEIGSIVVWRIVDTASAAFRVDNPAKFVQIQAEAAIRNLATQYPYDGHEEHQVSLRGHTQTIAERLQAELHDRVAQAGVEILEARISHLAYAPEIAQAMLQRQQAGAIIAARQRIVDGAVGMVQMALQKLSEHNVVHLDEERKAAMVSNLLVVLCGERATQPVVNTGTIYQ